MKFLKPSYRPFFLWPLLFSSIFGGYLLIRHFLGIPIPFVSRFMVTDNIAWGVPFPILSSVLASALAGLLVALAIRLERFDKIAVTVTAIWFLAEFAIGSLFIERRPFIPDAQTNQDPIICVNLFIAFICAVMSFGGTTIFSAIKNTEMGIVQRGLLGTVFSIAFFLPELGALCIPFAAASVTICGAGYLVFSFGVKMWEMYGVHTIALWRHIETNSLVDRSLRALAGQNGD